MKYRYTWINENCVHSIVRLLKVAHSSKSILLSLNIHKILIDAPETGERSSDTAFSSYTRESSEVRVNSSENNGCGERNENRNWKARRLTLTQVNFPVIHTDFVTYLMPLSTSTSDWVTLSEYTEGMRQTWEVKAENLLKHWALPQWALTSLRLHRNNGQKRLYLIWRHKMVFTVVGKR